MYQQLKSYIEEGTTNNGTDAKKENVCDKE
jgi:hypothetical protein